MIAKANIIDYYLNGTANQQYLVDKEWITFWQQKQIDNQKSLSSALLISSGIFVGVFIMLLIPLFVFNLLISFLKSNIAKSLANRCKRIYSKCAFKASKINQAENNNRRRYENQYNYQNEEYLKKEMDKYIKKHENTAPEKKIFQELNLPDENKVPLVLVNEQIAESYLKLKRNESMNFMIARNQLDIDEEVADIINKLTGTKLVIPEALAISTSNINKEEKVNEEEKNLEHIKIEIMNETSDLDILSDRINSPIEFTSDRYEKVTKPRFSVDSTVPVKDEERSELPKTSSIVASKSSAFMAPKNLLSVKPEHFLLPKPQPKQQQPKSLANDEKEEKDNEKSLKQIASEIKIVVQDYE